MLAQVAAAKAAGLQTADDKYATGSIEYQVYQKTKDEATPFEDRSTYKTPPSTGEHCE